jgi:hypothetical protein
VPTRVVHGEQLGQVWHTKTVAFPAKSTRRVRDVYTVTLGGQAAGTGYYRQASYTLYSGASWHGPIGRVVVNFHFPEHPRSVPLRPVSLRGLKKQNAAEVDWRRLPVGAVVYTGPGTPVVRGQTLSFVAQRLKPTPKDDISVAFGYEGYTASAG